MTFSGLSSMQESYWNSQIQKFPITACLEQDSGWQQHGATISNSATVQSTLINEHQQWTHIHVATLDIVSSDTIPQFASYIQLLSLAFACSGMKPTLSMHPIKFHTRVAPGSQTSNYQSMCRYPQELSPPVNTPLKQMMSSLDIPLINNWRCMVSGVNHIKRQHQKGEALG